MTKGGARAGSAWAVFLTFLRLGFTSFGGPIAHLGYFRRELVERRRWLSEEAYAGLIGFCQLLPGPTSSQAGFAIGLLRAGPWGGLAAWAGFTLPSAALMLGFAYGVTALSGPVAAGALHGLKLVAVPIVAQAVIGMASPLAPDLRRGAIAVLAGMALLATGWPAMQILVILGGAIAGGLLCAPPSAPARQIAGWTPGTRTGVMCLLSFAILLAAALLLAGRTSPIGLAALCYRAGALVFGGGHVVLPLLQAAAVPRWIDQGSFLAGYGFAQAMPGPLFSFGVFLGTRAAGPGGGAIALVAIFLPGLLLVTSSLALRDRLPISPRLRGAVAGVNAAVLGILAAMLYDPLWRSSIASPFDAGVAAAGLLMLLRWRAAPLAVVAFSTAAGMALPLAALLA